MLKFLYLEGIGCDVFNIEVMGPLGGGGATLALGGCMVGPDGGGGRMVGPDGGGGRMVGPDGGGPLLAVGLEVLGSSRGADTGLGGWAGGGPG